MKFNVSANIAQHEKDSNTMNTKYGQTGSFPVTTAVIVNDSMIERLNDQDISKI